MTTDRRVNARQQAARPSPVQLLSSGGVPVGIAVLEDVSAAGVRLAASGPCQAGAQLTLEAQRPHPLAGLHLSFRVTRCDAEPGGGYHVAGTFLRLLTDE